MLRFELTKADYRRNLVSFAEQKVVFWLRLTESWSIKCPLLFSPPALTLQNPENWENISVKHSLFSIDRNIFPLLLQSLSLLWSLWGTEWRCEMVSLSLSLSHCVWLLSRLDKIWDERLVTWPATAEMASLIGESEPTLRSDKKHLTHQSALFQDLILINIIKIQQPGTKITNYFFYKIIMLWKPWKYWYLFWYIETHILDYIYITFDKKEILEARSCLCSNQCNI